MRIFYNIIIGVAFAMAITACGNQKDAENLVKEFISDNAVKPETMELIEFGKLDSTKVISDSVIESMQQRENPLFKKGIYYADKSSGRLLYFIRAKIVVEGDTIPQTFYLDEQLQQVVAFK